MGNWEGGAACPVFAQIASGGNPALGIAPEKIPATVAEGWMYIFRAESSYPGCDYISLNNCQEVPVHAAASFVWAFKMFVCSYSERWYFNQDVMR